MNEQFNETSLDTLCGSLCEIMGIEPPEHAKKVNETIVEYAAKIFEGEKCADIIHFNIIECLLVLI